MRVFRNSTRRPRKRLRACRRFDQEEKARILNTNQFPRNLVRFEELKRSCQRGFVIPFVGAGMSKSAGCPEWKEYLLGLCDDARLDAAAMRERLESRGDYEGVMNDLVQSLGENRFNLDFERDFTTPENISGAVTLLPLPDAKCRAGSASGWSGTEPTFIPCACDDDDAPEVPASDG
jgi:hypothetical protein